MKKLLIFFTIILGLSLTGCSSVKKEAEEPLRKSNQKIIAMTLEMQNHYKELHIQVAKNNSYPRKKPMTQQEVDLAETLLKSEWQITLDTYSKALAITKELYTVYLDEDDWDLDLKKDQRYGDYPHNFYNFRVSVHRISELIYQNMASISNSVEDSKNIEMLVASVLKFSQVTDSDRSFSPSMKTMDTHERIVKEMLAEIK
ncbi:MAG: hypothetical protein KAH04_02760 [Psychrilyobacter sp.]|nr:hypothetical protein [Psychrilyobacter sp.]